MRRRRFLKAGLAFSASAFAPGTAGAQAPGNLPVDPQLGRILEGVRTGGRRLPGMIGALVQGGQLASIAAVGIRKVGSPEPMKPEDRVHLGSCTKAMTATLIGTLVDSGALRWDSTVGEAFPDTPGEYRRVTLRQLLEHRAGLPRDPARWSANPGLSIVQQRRAILARAFAEPPRAKPGSAYEYSNLGYMLAGAMAEEATRQPWEELIRRRVFEPLGMASAGFGPPGKPGRVNEPWGHSSLVGTLRPVQSDNAPAMGPAGTVHCSMPDWARFATLHLLGESNGVKLLRPETLRALHTPEPGGDYMGGWMVLERSWAGGRALTHSGSNTLWFCTVWLAPSREFALLVATNAGGKDAEAASDEAISAMIRAFELGGRGRRR